MAILTCEEFNNFMVDYLEDGLPIWRKYMCWMHVKMCQDCAHFVQQYRRVLELGQDAFSNPDDPVPNSVPEELIQAALAHRKHQ